MIKFYNTKMLSPDASSGDSDTPGKGTYAYDKMRIERFKNKFPDVPDAGFVNAVTENVLTHFESDHPVETEEPDAEKQIIYNHDYILEVDPSKSVFVRENKELRDADIRANLAELILADPVADPPTDPVTPVPGQSV